MCAAAQCPSLADPTNGQVTFSNSTNVGSIATYSCDTGFALNGNPMRTCQATGNTADWSGDDSTCERKITLLHAFNICQSQSEIM